MSEGCARCGRVPVLQHGAGLICGCWPNRPAYVAPKGEGGGPMTAPHSPSSRGSMMDGAERSEGGMPPPHPSEGLNRAPLKGCEACEASNRELGPYVQGMGRGTVAKHHHALNAALADRLERAEAIIREILDRQTERGRETIGVYIRAEALLAEKERA